MDDDLEEDCGIEVTITLIREGCKLSVGGDDAEDDVVEELLARKVLDLCGRRIGSMDGLEVMTQLEQLRLRHNLIRRVEGLDFLGNLTHLSLAHNRIVRAENLSHLAKLIELDLAYNRILAVDAAELPRGLRELFLRGNPCMQGDGKFQVLHGLGQGLPVLDAVDGVGVERAEGASASASAGGGDDAGTGAASGEERDGSEPRPWQCEYCEANFLRYREAAEHERQVHGVGPHVGDGKDGGDPGTMRPSPLSGSSGRTSDALCALDADLKTSWASMATTCEKSSRAHMQDRLDQLRGRSAERARLMQARHEAAMERIHKEEDERRTKAAATERAPAGDALALDSSARFAGLVAAPQDDHEATKGHK